MTLRQFALQLALASGYWVVNPDAMLARMPFRIFLEWIRYYQADPFGERRADLRIASLASVMANIWRGKNKPPYRAQDFLLQFEETIEEGRKIRPRRSQNVSGDVLFRKAMILNHMFGGKFVDKREK